MSLTKVAFFPHGSLILPSESPLEEARRLHEEMEKAAARILRHRPPERIVLLTPHGISLSEHFGLYANEQVEGTAEWQGEYSEFQISGKIDLEFTEFLFEELKKRGVPVSKITAFSRSMAIPLRWGEVVPLWFLSAQMNERVKKREENEVDNRKGKDTWTYSILSIPTRRYTDFDGLMPQLELLGDVLFDLFTSIEDEILLVASGDLAHTHQQTEIFPYSPRAEEFDQLAERWARSLDHKYLLDALKIQEEAMTCGIANMVILDRLLSRGSYSPTLVFRAHPTYYGMLVALFEQS